jgi:RNA polymerase sigma-70 factor (ECF subfamily)
VQRGTVVQDPLDVWVARARDGDHDAFGEIVRHTQTQVYNLAYQILRNPQEAEDLAQVAYVRAWRALPNFRGDSRFSTWLYRIVTNTCLNRRRQLGRSVELGDDHLALAADGQLQPESSVIERQTRRELWSAVGELPERYRTVLTLFYQAQLSYDDIAASLTLPLGTVKAQLSRARRALARLLERDEPHE